VVDEFSVFSVGAERTVEDGQLGDAALVASPVLGGLLGRIEEGGERVDRH
jgi:hypothetical protein